MKNINVQTLKTSEKTFFVVWLKILQSFLKLGKQEQLVLSRLLYYRYNLIKQVSNKSIVENILFSPEYRKLIKQELDIGTPSFNNTLSSLRRKKIIINNKINNKIIPKVETDFTNFKLVYNIEIVENI